MAGSRDWICLKVWRARLTDVGEVLLALAMRLFENQKLLFQSLKRRKTNREITKGARLSARVCLVRGFICSRWEEILVGRIVLFRVWGLGFRAGRIVMVRIQGLGFRV